MTFISFVKKFFFWGFAVFRKSLILVCNLNFESAASVNISAGFKDSSSATGSLSGNV